MLLLIGVVVVSTAVVFIHRVRGPGVTTGRAHGWMSAQWLAEYRGSNSP